MHHKRRVLASLIVSGTMLASVGAMARTVPQDDHERHEQEEREHRVYDPDRRDYHVWDQREDEVYRHWLEEKHEAYVTYDRLNRKRQREYWKWRHEHEEHEQHEHH